MDYVYTILRIGAAPMIIMMYKSFYFAVILEVIRESLIPKQNEEDLDRKLEASTSARGANHSSSTRLQLTSLKPFTASESILSNIPTII